MKHPTLEQTLLLGMAKDNAETAALALKSGMPAMARQHLHQALKEIELAEAAAPDAGLPAAPIHLIEA